MSLKPLIRLLLFSTILNFLCPSQPAAAQQGVPTVVVTQLGTISPASADILESAMRLAKEKQAVALVIELDTPGGLLESTRRIVRDILNAPIPVIVWVGPNGARAASAGAFITMAAHVAAMARATNIGAAHPVGVGLPTSKDGGDGKVAMEKALKDTLAMAESIANTRGRNVELARSFVLASESITAEEALANKVIDLLADSVDELLDGIVERPVKMESGSTINLTLKGARIVRHEKHLRHKILEVVSDPNIFYLLFLAGIIGLGFELTHPGVILPGVAGAICLLLALVAMSVLPINYGALGLLLSGLVMMIAELFVPSFGALGIGGIIAFILGSSLLFDPATGLAISIWTILPGALAVAGVLAFIGFVTLKAMRSRVMSGQEAMVGARAEVLRDFAGNTGQVRVNGEIWTAELPSGETALSGDRVVVKKVDGLKLFVSRE